MARMGVYFEEEVQRRYPEFPTRKGEWGWQDYVPPMSPGLHKLIETYGTTSSARPIFVTAAAIPNEFSSDFFARLEASGDIPILQELRDGKTFSVTGSELLRMVADARRFIAARNIAKGERCALLAHNSIRWAAMDLALIAEGLTVVPLARDRLPSNWRA